MSIKRPSDKALKLTLQEQAQENLRFHALLFGALNDWDHAALELAYLNDKEIESALDLLGLDQTGHFGPQGCDKVIDTISQIGFTRIDALSELGSGFGGSLRYITTRLAQRQIQVRLAVGLELVRKHCDLWETIDSSLSLRTLDAICASAGDMPLKSGSFDLIIAVGSVPHFRDMPSVIRESYRCLRPGGWLVFTEEVSLVAKGTQLSPRFRHFHPLNVFYHSSIESRHEQLRAAGFEDIHLECIAEWAIELLHQRLKGAKIFKGTLNRVLGEESHRRVIGTLTSTVNEYERNAIIPAIVRARKLSSQ